MWLHRFLKPRFLYAGFYCICYSPLNGMLAHCKVTPEQYVTSTHLYTWAQLFEGRLVLTQG